MFAVSLWLFFFYLSYVSFHVLGIFVLTKQKNLTIHHRAIPDSNFEWIFIDLLLFFFIITNFKLLVNLIVTHDRRLIEFVQLLEEICHLNPSVEIQNTIFSI